MAVNKGNYYKLKTKKWLVAQGYQCDYLERLQRLYTPKGVIFVKRDMFASDILAMNEEEIIFVQVKLGRKNIASAYKEFAKFVFPPFVKRWIIVWEERARQPEIIPMDSEE